MLTLRGHHLICLNFFSGEGYDENFIKNLKELLRRAELELVEVCIGADDVCIKCHYLRDYKCQYDENAEQEIKEMDEKALTLLKIKIQTRLSWQEIKGRIPDIFADWAENYCNECDWKAVCGNNHFYQKLSSMV